MTFLASHMGRALDFEAANWIQAERFCNQHGLTLQGRLVETFNDPKQETRH